MTMGSPVVTRTAKVVAFVVLVTFEWVLIRYARLNWVATAFAASAAALIAGMTCAFTRTMIRDARARHRSHG